MKEVRISVKTRINASQDIIKSKLSNLSSYPIWFPERFRPRGVTVNGNKTLMFSALPGVKIAWEKVDSEDANTIQLKYVKGPVTGTTWWLVRPHDEYTEIENVMEVTGKSWLIHFFMSNPIFRWKHIFDMKSVMRGLAKASTSA